MTERVEAIRRWHDNSGHKAHFPHCETCEVVTALAQAERERETMRSELANLRVLHEANCHYKSERDAARAEVERLKGEIEQYEGWGEQRYREGRADGQREAEAALARVRAALDDMCVDYRWRNRADYPEAKPCWVCGGCKAARLLRAALEGRG